MEHTRHIPVLLRETIDGLALKNNAVVIDATLGAGGHFSEIIENIGARGMALGIDADVHAVADAQARLGDHANARYTVGNFRHVAQIAHDAEITKADAILADLGWRIEQFGHDAAHGGGKGFSFREDEPLHMTFGKPEDYPFTAGDIVNEWSAEDIENVLRGYGEERYARKIAHAIVTERAEKPILTSRELAQVIERSVPARYRHGKINPATKTFQALRIAVNDELDALASFIEGAHGLLREGGRLAVITFHSIEDRVVKHSFRKLKDEGRATLITKKPITPSAEEIHKNPRARSAKLRIIEKT